MRAGTILAFLGCAAVASATSVTFTFDAQTINGTNIAGLSSGATSAQIQSYMNQVLSAAGCAGCSVTVLVNGNTIGAVADQTYNGEGHVVSNTSGKSLTLGTSDNATNNSTLTPTNTGTHPTYDTFIANTNDSSGTVSQQITLQFSGFTGLGMSVNSFDYEIFPDGTCTSLSSTNCGGAKVGNVYPNQPDLKLEAGNNTNGTDPLATSFGGNFGTGGIQYGVAPSSSGAGSDGTATHSPLSGTGSTEAAPQFIGTWNGSITNATELDFIDWPATIGIDNLNLSWTPRSSVPEPMSVVLFGTLIAGLATYKKFQKTA